MKKCPSCGYEDTLTQRTLLRRYKKAFGGIPVREMIKRCWLKVGELGSVEEVRRELIRFFELKDADELEAFIHGAPLPNLGMRVCRIEPGRELSD